MSIYDDGFAIDPKTIVNKKSANDVAKQTKAKSGKEFIYSDTGELLGILQRDGTPYIFTDKELKEYEELLKEK